MLVDAAIIIVISMLHAGRAKVGTLDQVSNCISLRCARGF